MDRNPLASPLAASTICPRGLHGGRAPPKLPNFDPLWYCAAQPLGTILHAVRKLGSIVGQTIVVVGQGQNGLLMTAVLANAGARRVIALDRLPDRLAVASRLGATHTLQVEPASPSLGATQLTELEQSVREMSDGEMADVAIDMVGHQGRTLDLCARLCKSFGTVVLFGLPPGEEHDALQIRMSDFVRNLKFACSHSPPMELFELALELLQQGRVDVSPIFTHSVPFEQFPEAYEKASTYADGIIKAVLTFENRELCAPCESADDGAAGANGTHGGSSAAKTISSEELMSLAFK